MIARDKGPKNKKNTCRHMRNRLLSCTKKAKQLIKKTTRFQ